MRMKLLVALVATIVMALAATVAPAQAVPGGGGGGGRADPVPVTGQVGDFLFEGTATLERFTTQNGQLAAVVDIVGLLTNTVTGAVQNIDQTLIVPVTVNQARCEILDLTLRPLDLDLLGLVIHLDQVHLTITAESGPGNLLGNLLCGIAGVLDQGIPVNQLANPLNQFLNLLR